MAKGAGSGWAALPALGGASLVQAAADPPLASSARAGEGEHHAGLRQTVVRDEHHPAVAAPGQDIAEQGDPPWMILAPLGPSYKTTEDVAGWLANH